MAPIKTLNNQLGSKSSSLSDLEKTFSKLWPSFRTKLEDIKKIPDSSGNIIAAFGDASGINITSNDWPDKEVEKANINVNLDRDVNVGPVISSEQAFQRINAAIRQNLEQLKENFEQARKDSRQFFRLTMIFAGIGFLVVLTGVALFLFNEFEAGVVASIASVIPEVTAALFFKKDSELRRTIETYHNHILRSQNLLTMIDVCETIIDKVERDKIKQKIILKALDITPQSNSTETT